MTATETIHGSVKMYQERRPHSIEVEGLYYVAMLAGRVWHATDGSQWDHGELSSATVLPETGYRPVIASYPA